MSTALLKKQGKYLENKVFVKPIWYQFIFLRMESNLGKTFLKKVISILSIYLHHLEDLLDKSSIRFKPTSFPEKYTQKIILVNSNVIIFYFYYTINHINQILLHFCLWLKVLNLVKMRFNKTTVVCQQTENLSGFTLLSDLIVKLFIKNANSYKN